MSTERLYRNNMQDLPEEVLEYILTLVSPYADLDNCQLVCHQWHRNVRDVIKRLKQCFWKAVVEMNITWTCLPPEPGPCIMGRYSHSACWYNNSMFVFGGCTLMETAFNDLWRFDLSTRSWVRPLAVGTYPPPSACATLVAYKDILVLFGGWACSSSSLLYQGRRCFNTLYFYHPDNNRWLNIITQTSPPPMAKHTATIHKDWMIVFGGVQLENSQQCFSFNEVWVLDLVTPSWYKQPTITPKPEPRFGHSQVAVDDDHILIFGGCGGPNQVLNDAWLLTIVREPGAFWIWQKVSIKNPEFGASHLWYHQACKVRDKLVILSRSPQLKPSYLVSHAFRSIPRVWYPPHIRVESERSPSRQSSALERHREQVDVCINGRKGTFIRRGRLASVSAGNGVQPASAAALLPTSSTVPCSSPATISSPSLSATSYLSSSLYSPGPSGYQVANHQSDVGSSCSHSPCSSNGCSALDDVRSSKTPSDNYIKYDHPVVKLSLEDLKPTSSGTTAVSPNATASVAQLYKTSESPSCPNGLFSLPPRVRPNAVLNSQRRLDVLKRMEERINNLRQLSLPSPPSPPFPSAKGPNSDLPYSPRKSTASSVKRPMCMCVLDISRVLQCCEVSWLPFKNQFPSSAPEETMFFSLIEGKGELVMFGGIQNRPSAHCQLGGESQAVISNMLYFISPKKYIV